MRLGHERSMFGVFWACLEPRDIIKNNILKNLACFQFSFVKKCIFCPRNFFQTHVNQNIGCRFFCMCRGDTKQRAFARPDHGKWFTYPHDGSKVSRKYSRDAWRSDASHLEVKQAKSWKIWISKIFEKKCFEGQNDSKKNVF